jgi:spore coat polysaccharide biosynthesis protein SpsF
LSASSSKIGLIIPTRYKSERLPGKVLIDINGKPNIERIIERALNSKYIEQVVLAISEEDCKEIVDWYESKRYDSSKVNIFIGEHNNLIKRTLDAAKIYNINTIVDTSHCCSLLDSCIIDNLIDRMVEYNADYSSNCITRTFPDGFDIQVYTRNIYESIESIIPNNHKTRMWTGWNIWHWRESLYPKPKIINYESTKEFYHPEWRVTLDTVEDLKVIRGLYAFYGDKYFDYKNIILYLSKFNKLANIDIKPTELLQEQS